MKQQNVFSVALIIAYGDFLFSHEIDMMPVTSSTLRNLFNLNVILHAFISALAMPGIIASGKFTKLNLDY